MTFDKDKKNALTKLDKSKKGFVDEEIELLVKIINEHPNYYTTSSCSGRIIILSLSPKKHLTKWHFVSHKPVTLQQIKEAPYEKGTIFVMESFILHVCVKTIEDAQRLLSTTQACGLKRAGIISLGRRIIMEIIGNENLVTPFGPDTFTQEGLNALVCATNEKLQLNHRRMKKFENAFRKGFIPETP